MFGYLQRSLTRALKRRLSIDENDYFDELKRHSHSYDTRESYQREHVTRKCCDKRNNELIRFPRLSVVYGFTRLCARELRYVIISFVTKKVTRL